jgi:hypothetical protein
MLSAQPISREELAVLAAVYFPDPGRPGAEASNGHAPPWFHSAELRRFWDGFTHGRALPGGN